MRIVTRLESVVAASKVALREAENEHGRVEQGHAERKARSDECRAELRRWEASAEEHSQEELRNRCTVAEALAQAQEAAREREHGEQRVRQLEDELARYARGGKVEAARKDVARTEAQEARVRQA